jgi:Zn finger protein HypA/HybF involved in hydrogenase expression
MHESGLVRSLLREIESVARQDDSMGSEVVVRSVRLRMGALSPFSEGHLREHFIHEAKGTIVEGATLIVEHPMEPAVLPDCDLPAFDASAQDLVLLSIEVQREKYRVPSTGYRTDDRRPTTLDD